MTSPDAPSLIQLFNACFAECEHTVLQGDGEEPYYHPAEAEAPARIVFRADYVSSAMHEIAHWCVAGPERRKVPDFGYWYEPDGRSDEQQAVFERVEVKPQAMEWAFSLAAGIGFHFSADNLNGGAQVSERFQREVWQQTCRYLQQGLPARAQRWFDCLRAQRRESQPIALPAAPC